MKLIQKIALLILALTGCMAIGYTFLSYKKESTYKAIIFDMDGTIIDTDHLWKIGNGPILDSHAPHLTQIEKDALIDQFKYLTIYEVWNLVHKACSIDISMDQLIEENIGHLHTIYQTQGISFIPHFHEFHDKAIACGLKTAIATSSQGRTVDIILQAVPLTNYFAEHIYHVDHVNRNYKPKPDVYLHAAKMIGVNPVNCIAIEDSASGIKAAKAAGMYCIGINTGKNKALLQQADEIVDCFKEIDLEKLMTR